VTYSGDDSHRETYLLNQLDKHHHEEWRACSVDEQLIRENVLSLAGYEPHERLLYALPPEKRRNDGRVRDAILKRYQHLEHGGWYITGLDPKTNWVDVMAWGRFKPDQPRIDGNGKTIKYESPLKPASNRVTYYRVPLHLWREIASRYGVKLYHSPLALRLTTRKQPVNFWSWVKNHPEIPIILTEGEKKAGAVLSQGYAAISLPGIWGGRNSKGKDPEQKLHHDLMHLAGAGRTLIILFDYDQKQSTREAVYKATLATGKAIEATGACCKVALLPGQEKGIDDFITARGLNAAKELCHIITNAHPIEEYKWLANPQDEELIRYAPRHTICTQYLTDGVEIDLERPGLIAIKSEMATGKTTRVKEHRIANPDERFLVIGHRIALLRELSQPNKLNTTMYSDVFSGSMEREAALSITVDSFHKLKTEGNNYDCIFIDEARQVLRHILMATTCKLHRQDIISKLQYFIRKARQVIIADAHLDDYTVDFFLSMRQEGETPLIIQNTYQHPSREVFYYEGSDYTAQLAQLTTAVSQGKKVMAVSDSKSTIEKIEQVLADKFVTDSDSQKSSKVIWSIHSDNSGSEENQNFINNISKAVKNVDVLLASPSLCTGVDIQGDHFDEVYGFFNAVALTATDCLQALHRYRHTVPFHIWVAPKPSFGYKDTNAQVIRDKKWQISDFNNFALSIDPDTGKNIPILNWAFELTCQIEAQSNRSLNNLRDHLHRLLARMGYQITVVETDTDNDAKAQIKEATQKVNEHHIQQVTVAQKIDKGQYLQLKNKPYLTPEEKYAMERFRIEDSYGQRIDRDLVKRDSKGAYLSQLITLEAVLSPPTGSRVDSKTKRRMPIPPKLVIDKDLWELDNLPFLPDRQHFCAQWFIWHSLGITQILKRLFEGEEYSAGDSDVIKLAEVVGKYRQEIQAILGFWIPTKSSPTWILGMLLNKLGLKTKSCKRGGSGQQILHYSLAVEELIFAREVLKYRQQQRILKSERQRQRQEENRLHQIMMATQYSIDYQTKSISTPTGNNNIPNKQQGIDMAESNTTWVIEKMQASLSLLTELVDRGTDVIQELFPPTLELNLVHKVLIRYLNNPMNFIPHSSTET
jgi:hypothetical protein